MGHKLHESVRCFAGRWSRTSWLALFVAWIVLLGCAGPVTDTVSPEQPAPTTELDEMAETPNPAATTSQPTATTVPATPTATQGSGNADVLQVRAVQGTDGTWTFHVTVEHPDVDWDDYADGWDVVTPDGTVLKPDPDEPFTRTLLHPHENEQPFTRSQSGIEIPAGVTVVRVRAHDLVDGFGGQEVVVDLTAKAGPGFEVER